MVALAIRSTVYNYRSDFFGRLGDCRRFFGRKSFATIRGTMSFFYLWDPALGACGHRRDLRSLSELCADDVRLYRPVSDRGLPVCDAGAAEAAITPKTCLCAPCSSRSESIRFHAHDHGDGTNCQIDQPAR
jgi:hypothetical protein